MPNRLNFYCKKVDEISARNIFSLSRNKNDKTVMSKRSCGKRKIDKCGDFSGCTLVEQVGLCIPVASALEIYKKKCVYTRKSFFFLFEYFPNSLLGDIKESEGDVSLILYANPVPEGGENSVQKEGESGKIGF